MQVTRRSHTGTTPKRSFPLTPPPHMKGAATPFCSPPADSSDAHTVRYSTLFRKMNVDGCKGDRSAANLKPDEEVSQRPKPDIERCVGHETGRPMMVSQPYTATCV